MIKKDDWRLRGQETYLKGVTLVHIKYRINNKKLNWDHDHCEFCWAKFMVDDYPEVLHIGYVTDDDNTWICENCFNDFKNIFQWKVIKSKD